MQIKVRTYYLELDLVYVLMESVCFVSCANVVVVYGLTSVNSQMLHMSLDSCENVMIKNVRIIAPGSSPYTDGIHLLSIPVAP